MNALTLFCLVVAIGIAHCTECHNNHVDNHCHGLQCLDADAVVGCIDDICTCVSGPRKCTAGGSECAGYECKDHDHRANCGSAGYCGIKNQLLST